MDVKYYFLFGVEFIKKVNKGEKKYEFAIFYPIYLFVYKCFNIINKHSIKQSAFIS